MLLVKQGFLGVLPMRHLAPPPIPSLATPVPPLPCHYLSSISTTRSPQATDPSLLLAPALATWPWFLPPVP